MSRTYRIMIADDEGIVIESLRFIIDRQFPDCCDIQTAKTGRSVIEVTEEFRPDIIFMDIQMPGINGIDAMKEIRKFNTDVIFIVLSAYDKFDYAKEAIGLGVLDYLNKPFSKDMIDKVLRKAFDQIDHARNRRKQDLVIKEKMENIAPFVENSFVYTILFHECDMCARNKYRELLNITQDYAYVLVISAEDSKPQENEAFDEDIELRLQNAYPKLREIIKDHQECVVGPALSNKIICVVPCRPNNLDSDYNMRVSIIERSRQLEDILHKKCHMSFRCGIGTIKPFPELEDSYQEALTALQSTITEVAHAGDLTIGCEYDDNYPIEDERKIFESEKNGDITGVMEAAERFFDWMKENYPDNLMDIRLKCLEFVLWAEHQSYMSGGLIYHFTSRTDYLPQLLEMEDLSAIQKWFLHKISDATYHMIVKKETSTDSLIQTAVDYMQKHYSRDLSLDEVSRYVDVSPYYFSRLFKEEMKSNFIEFLTNLRVEKAKDLITNSNYTMREICSEIGYTDPNYFSRIFKKSTGMTPTEYKDNMSKRGITL